MRRFHGRKAVVPTRDLADGEVEKMYFDRLLGFVYREVMKGSQKGFVPKRCDNCERWFLQMQGMTCAYCVELVPGQDGRICREIGAAAVFAARCRTMMFRRGINKNACCEAAQTCKGVVVSSDGLSPEQMDTMREKYGEYSFVE